MTSEAEESKDEEYTGYYEGSITVRVNMVRMLFYH